MRGLLRHITMKNEFDCIGSLLFFRVNHLCVYLGCLDVGMSKHFADGKQVSALGELIGCIRVAETVESEWLSKEKQTGED